MTPSEKIIVAIGALMAPATGHFISPSFGWGVLAASAVGFAAARLSRKPSSKEDLFTDVPSTQFTTSSLTESISSMPHLEWIPFGKTVTIHGHAIKGGCFIGHAAPDYIGKGTEPSLIDATLLVAPTGAKGKLTDLWPRYSTLSPVGRAAFLEWSAEGRKDPDVDIGIVFIHFYGLERRLFTMPAKSTAVFSPRREILSIKTEAERLLSIYGNNKSFREYAVSLIGISDVLSSMNGPYPGENPRLAVGRAVSEGKPISVDNALAWGLKEETIPKGEAAEKIPEMFARAFRHFYEKKYKDGMTLTVPQTAVKAAATHQFASAGFEGRPPVSVKTKFPDVTGMPEAMFSLTDIFLQAEKCLQEYLGAKKVELPFAEIYLPSFARGEKGNKRISIFRNSVRSEQRTIHIDTLVKELFGYDSIPRGLDEELFSRLEEIGVGMELDDKTGMATLFMDDGIPASVDRNYCEAIMYACDGATPNLVRDAINIELEPQGIRDYRIIDSVLSGGVDLARLSEWLKKLPLNARETVADICLSAVDRSGIGREGNLEKIISRLGLPPSFITDRNKSVKNNDTAVDALFHDTDDGDIVDIAATPTGSLPSTIHAFAVAMFGLENISVTNAKEKATELGTPWKEALDSINERAEEISGRPVFMKSANGESIDIDSDSLSMLLASLS